MSERRVRRRKPRLKFDKQMYKKLGILFWIVVLALFALCTRIAYLNVAKGDNYSIKVLEQQSFTSKTIPYKKRRHKGQKRQCIGNKRYGIQSYNRL